MKKLFNNSPANCKILCLLAALIIHTTTAAQAESEHVSRVLAKVGNEVVTSAELERFLKPWLMKYGNEYNKDELADLTSKAKQAALKQFIERKLLTQEANALQIEIPDVEVTKEMERIRSQFKSNADFKKFLEQEKMSIEDCKDLIKDDLKTKVIVHDKVAKKISILPSKIHDYYQLHVTEFLQPAQVYMYQILIKKNPTPQAALKKANEILMALEEGAEFQQMARLRSEGPKRSTGGDWGIVEQGFFGDEMANVEKTAFELKPGQFSKIVETKYGYHIVYIDRKRISRILSEREAYNSIKNRLFMEQYAEGLDDYINYLRNKTYVEIMQPDLSPEFSLRQEKDLDRKPEIISPTPIPTISPQIDNNKDQPLDTGNKPNDVSQP